jgi:hypothetical protein
MKDMRDCRKLERALSSKRCTSNQAKSKQDKQGHEVYFSGLQTPVPGPVKLPRTKQLFR